jgi:hypothetical protein
MDLQPYDTIHHDKRFIYLFFLLCYFFLNFHIFLIILYSNSIKRI